jgi:hypothetical protein
LEAEKLELKKIEQVIPMKRQGPLESENGTDGYETNH